MAVSTQQYIIRGTSTQSPRRNCAYGSAHVLLALIMDPLRPIAINRFTERMKTQFGILDGHLKDRNFLVGSGKGRFTIADVMVFSW